MENYYRNKVTIEGALEFQNLTWEDFDESPELEGDDNMSVESEEYAKQTDEKYTIRAYGCTIEGYSVCLTIKDFTPFFYVKVPESYSKAKVNILLSKLVEKMDISPWTMADDGSFTQTFKKHGKNLIKSKCTLSKKKSYYGFTNNEELNFLRLVFDNKAAMKHCLSIINKHNEGKKKLIGISETFDVYEGNVDPIIRFVHIKDLKFSGWISVAKPEYKIGDESISRSQIEAVVNWQSVLPLDKGTTNAPILQASYDIETYSHRPNAFPLPEIKENVIFQIATTFKYFGSDKFYMRHIVCLGNVNPLKIDDDIPTFMHCYNTEREVLLAWRDLINNMGPDIMYGYNTSGFDDKYINIRVKGLECSIFYDMGKLINVKAKLIDSIFSSSAYGMQRFKRLTIPGIIHFDVMTYIQREYKENSYTLNDISKKYLDEKKNPVTPQMMFKYFKESNLEGLRETAEYCIQDTMLPQKLVDKMHILQNQISMSMVTYVPIKFLLEKGQSVKVFSQVLKETRNQGFLIPTLKKVESGKFKGATVKDPMSGAYYLPVTVLDFESLYPGIIREHNLGYITIVLNKKYMNLPGIDYRVFEWEDTDKESAVVTKHKYTYVQNVPSIISDILTTLSESRKKYKGLMKTANNSFDYEVYNKMQLAYKVSMNSLYGFLGAQLLTCKPIAATVTYVGRTMIDKTSKYIEDNYPASVVVYGDSVTGDTPLIIKGDHGLEIISIEKLVDDLDYISYDGFKADELGRNNKQQASTHYSVWTPSGWAKIKRVIRHSTNKKIYRVQSDFGCVDVTEDHSLLDSNNQILKPHDCEINATHLLYSYPMLNNKLSNLSISQAYILGLFDKNNKNLHSIDQVLNAGVDVMKSYLDGHGNKKIYITSSKLSAAKMYYILTQVHQHIIIESPSYSMYKLTINKIETKSNYNVVRSITELQFENPEYVYDLETEDGRFLAGIGKTVVKNTDSVFVKFTTESTNKYTELRNNTTEDSQELEDLKCLCIKESMELGQHAATAVTAALFKNPTKLAFEKVLLNLLLLTKKRYIALYYSSSHLKYDYIMNKGVILTRRDSNALLKRVYTTMIDLIMKDWNNGAVKSVEYIRDILSDIGIGNIDLSEFIISKTLKEDYKSQNLPHVTLANKLKERDPGSAPRSNDRIPYIFIDIGATKKISQYHKVEDPDYAAKNKLPLDVEYYMTCMMKPLCEVLRLFVDKPEKIFKEAVMDYRETKW